MPGLPCPARQSGRPFRGPIQPRRADPGRRLSDVERQAPGAAFFRRSGRSGSGFQPAMMRAHSLAWTLSRMPGKRRRSSTAADSSPRCSIDGADGSSLLLGHGEHAGSMGLAAWAQQAARLGWSSRDGRQGCTPRADREVTIQSVSGYRSSSAESKMAQRHVSPALRHQLLQAGQRLMPAAAFAPTAT